MWDKYIVPGSGGMQEDSLAGSNDGAATLGPFEGPLVVETEALGEVEGSWSAGVVAGPVHCIQEALLEHRHMVSAEAWGLGPADRHLELPLVVVMRAIGSTQIQQDMSRATQ